MRKRTFSAFVPAYCRLITSPLLAQSSIKGIFNWSGTGVYGGISPSLTNCDSKTARPIAVCTTFVRSKQSMQLTRKTAFWLQIVPFWSHQWNPIAAASGANASMRADTFSNRMPRLEYRKIHYVYCRNKCEPITSSRENRTLRKSVCHCCTWRRDFRTRRKSLSPFRSAQLSWLCKWIYISSAPNRSASRMHSESPRHLWERIKSIVIPCKQPNGTCTANYLDPILAEVDICIQVDSNKQELSLWLA